MENTLSGSIYFIQPIAWFVPLSVSFVMFVASFFLLGPVRIPAILFVTIYSILIFSMYLTHVAEAVTFMLILVLYSLIYRNTHDKIKMNLALISCLLGFVVATVFSYYISFMWESPIRHDTSNTTVMILLLAFLVFNFNFTTYQEWKKYHRQN